MIKSFQIYMIALLAGLLIFGSMTGAAHAVSDKYRDLSARLTVDAEQKLLQEKSSEADELLNLALTADPGNARAFVLKGKAQTAMGNAEEGLRLVSVGLEIEPGDKEGLRLKGEFAAGLGQIEDAETALSRLRSICDAPCATAEDLSQVIDKARDTQKD